MKVSIEAARVLALDILQAQGVPGDVAIDVAAHLVEADRSGYTSHGLSILPTYSKAIAQRSVNPVGRAVCALDKGARIVFDGNMGFGQHVGKQVMKTAIDRTRQHGLCIVTLRKAHHLGRMGHYGEMVAKEGLVLLSFTNVINRAPTVAPWGGRVARMTTNPLCFAGPMPNGRPPLVLDMATSAIAVNKARVLADKGEPAPPQSVIDAEGRPTTDAGVMFANPPGALLPFGAHKGYGLGVVAEMLAGVLTGGGTIRPGHQAGVVTNNLFAILLDPEFDLGLPWAGTEVEAFIQYLHDTPTAPGAGRVQYPGEYEAQCRERNATHLEIAPAIWEKLEQLAQEVGAVVPA